MEDKTGAASFAEPEHEVIDSWELKADAAGRVLDPEPNRRWYLAVALLGAISSLALLLVVSVLVNLSLIHISEPTRPY